MCWQLGTNVGYKSLVFSIQTKMVFRLGSQHTVSYTGVPRWRTIPFVDFTPFRLTTHESTIRLQDVVKQTKRLSP